jgi:hypothetical protein
MNTASFQLRVHSACCPICDVPYTKFVVGVKAAGGMKLTTHLNLASKSRMSETISPRGRGQFTNVHGVTSQKMALVFRARSITGVGWRMCTFISYKLGSGMTK